MMLINNVLLKYFRWSVLIIVFFSVASYAGKGRSQPSNFTKSIVSEQDCGDTKTEVSESGYDGDIEQDNDDYVDQDEEDDISLCSTIKHSSQTDFSGSESGALFVEPLHSVEFNVDSFLAAIKAFSQEAKLRLKKGVHPDLFYSDCAFRKRAITLSSDSRPKKIVRCRSVADISDAVISKEGCACHNRRTRDTLGLISSVVPVSKRKESPKENQWFKRIKRLLAVIEGGSSQMSAIFSDVTENKLSDSPEDVTSGIVSLKKTTCHKVGNCLFDAVAEFVGRVDGEALRRGVVDYVAADVQLTSVIDIGARKGETLRRTVGDESHDEPYTNREQYLSLMRQDQTWGTGIEVIGLARMLQRPIMIALSFNHTYQLIADPDYANNDPIFLIYDGFHYAIDLRETSDSEITDGTAQE